MTKSSGCVVGLKSRIFTDHTSTVTFTEGDNSKGPKPMNEENNQAKQCVGTGACTTTRFIYVNDKNRFNCWVTTLVMVVPPRVGENPKTIEIEKRVTATVS